MPGKERYENEAKFTGGCGRLIVSGWLDRLRPETDTCESFMGVLCDQVQQLAGGVEKAKRVWQRWVGTCQRNGGRINYQSTRRLRRFRYGVP